MFKAHVINEFILRQFGTASPLLEDRVKAFDSRLKRAMLSDRNVRPWSLLASLSTLFGTGQTLLTPSMSLVSGTLGEKGPELAKQLQCDELSPVLLLDKIRLMVKRDADRIHDPSGVIDASQLCDTVKRMASKRHAHADNLQLQVGGHGLPHVIAEYAKVLLRCWLQAEYASWAHASDLIVLMEAFPQAIPLGLRNADGEKKAVLLTA